HAGLRDHARPDRGARGGGRAQPAGGRRPPRAPPPVLALGGRPPRLGAHRPGRPSGCGGPPRRTASRRRHGPRGPPRPGRARRRPGGPRRTPDRRRGPGPRRGGEPPPQRPAAAPAPRFAAGQHAASCDFPETLTPTLLLPFHFPGLGELSVADSDNSPDLLRESPRA